MMQEQGRSLDPQLWHACAGGMVHIAPVNSLVFYFPQDHAEHASSAVVFPYLRIPPLVLCRVASIEFLADMETDKVFATMGLVPLCSNRVDIKDDASMEAGGLLCDPGKTVSFAKMLTQSDANSGGGFSVPRYCAEMLFPKLDYSLDPPVQTVVARDVHGMSWKFRHVYRGTPRRHLLTTGWSTLVNRKNLVAGDSIVFLRSVNGGDLCVRIRRAKRGIGDGPELLCSGRNPRSSNFIAPFGDSFCVPLREEDSKFMRGKDRLSPESVIAAANLTASPFKARSYTIPLLAVQSSS